MASNKSQSKQRSQGGGRTSNSEPRVQVFQQFGGCNFQLSPRDFTLGQQPDQEQSDLQMNYVVIQNNAMISDNKTIETRSNIVKLFDAPVNRKLNGNCILIGDELYVATDTSGKEESLFYNKLSENPDEKYDWKAVEIIDNNNTSLLSRDWISFAYIDDKLVGMTSDDQLWTGNVKDHSLSNAKRVDDPDPIMFSNLKPKGKLKIKETVDTDDDDEKYPNRISIAIAYINKYGPTNTSDELTFFASEPVAKWHNNQYLRITGEAPTGQGIVAVEIYYSAANSSTLLLAGRKDFKGGDGGKWYFDWYGYENATYMWPMANLLSPNDNYTEGVKASHVTCIDGRLYFWGSRKNPQRLWIGGNPSALFSISSGTGGGFVDIEPGTNQEIRVVDKYKTQSGNSIVTMLCDSPNSGKEQRYNLVENTITLSSDEEMKSWQAEQVAGAVGCKSYRGAQVCEDGLYSISRYGVALTTMTMEYNSQIRANYISDAIKPVFTNKKGSTLKNSVMLEKDGVLYICFGKDDRQLDNVLFCYDIDLKAWWTYTLNPSETILNLINIDSDIHQEGIGIITEKSIYMLPLTYEDSPEDETKYPVLIQTGELSTTQPQQNWFYMSQLEFNFDYFLGEMKIELTGIDQFGRKISTVKNVSHETVQYNLSEFMRVDLRMRSYQIRITGECRFRMTHFMAKLYTMSSKQGLVWGFDDSQSYRTDGDIHPTFKDYNDIRKAIIP